MWPLPCTYSCPGRQRLLGVDDAVPGFGEVPPQGVADKHSIEVPPPGYLGCSTELPQEQPRAEHRISKRPTPRVCCDHRGRCSLPIQMPTDLPNMSVHASAAVFWDEDGYHYWPRIIYQQHPTMSTGLSAIVVSVLKEFHDLCCQRSTSRGELTSASVAPFIRHVHMDGPNPPHRSFYDVRVHSRGDDVGLLPCMAR
jgi:hypothetical protein